MRFCGVFHGGRVTLSKRISQQIGRVTLTGTVTFTLKQCGWISIIQLPLHVNPTHVMPSHSNWIHGNVGHVMASVVFAVGSQAHHSPDRCHSIQLDQSLSLAQLANTPACKTVFRPCPTHTSTPTKRNIIESHHTLCARDYTVWYCNNDAAETSSSETGDPCI